MQEKEEREKRLFLPPFPCPLITIKEGENWVIDNSKLFSAPVLT